MAITSIKTGSSFTNLKKYNDFLAGNTAYNPPNFYSLATVSVGAGGSSAITFSSIPSGYKHLQIRAIVRTNRSAGVDIMSMRMNSDTGNNYADHLVYGDGANVQLDRNSSYGKINIQRVASDNLNNGVVSPFVIDILDYTNTNKNTTVRYLGGYDANGSGRMVFGSGLWLNTDAITTITLEGLEFSSNYNQYSRFTLYGVR
jgi:hypothetical protein